MTITTTQVLAAKGTAAPRADISAEDVPFHEITGLDVSVLGAPNRSLVGLSGRIQYETKSMIAIVKEEDDECTPAAHRAGRQQQHRRRDASKWIPKRGAVLEFSQSGTRIGTANGNAMLKRPFERAAA